mmetsp:Transcript_77612/g.177727  ORF Transcript_77612/g.177727 Transcript_77612/m.177727 type:complete len:181 (-) Transcript_77612:275-817(-)
MEVLHKEGTGTDHLAVAVVLPDGTEQLPMPVSYFVAGSVNCGRRLQDTPVVCGTPPLHRLCLADQCWTGRGTTEMQLGLAVANVTWGGGSCEGGLLLEVDGAVPGTALILRGGGSVVESRGVVSVNASYPGGFRLGELVVELQQDALQASLVGMLLVPLCVGGLCEALVVWQGVLATTKM